MSNVLDFLKSRGILKRSVIYKAVGLLVAVYIFATQFAGPPNYYATYDGAMPPKGPYGPVSIRKDRNDRVGEGRLRQQDRGGRRRRDRGRGFEGLVPC